jgi:isoleucyl-tRNA synthetase
LQNDILAAYENFQFHQIYQKLHHFCVVDMGSFYLDILKDRLYTMPVDSIGRRSAQTAMFHILEALARWLAPILSFTADEIWKYMPGERGDSVFLETWYQLPETSGVDMAYWSRVIEVREQVSKELEKARVAGVIGSSLNAEVDLYCDSDLRDLLGRLEDELRFVLITSYARVHALSEAPDDAVAAEDLEGLRIAVNASEYKKCERCWHQREDVGSDPEHPTLCARCAGNVSGKPEPRSHA